MIHGLFIVEFFFLGGVIFFSLGFSVPVKYEELTVDVITYNIKYLC